MARDKTDKTDLTPVATPATTATLGSEKNDYQTAVSRIAAYINDGLKTGVAADPRNEHILIASSPNDYAVIIGRNLQQAFGWDYLFAKAKTEPDAYQAARRLVAHMLEKREPLPDAARTWLTSLLRDELDAPKKKTGAQANLWLKELIWCSIISLQRVGFSATRNDATGLPSACDVVAEAMAEIGKKPDNFETVKKVWGERNMLLPPYLEVQSDCGKS